MSKTYTIEQLKKLPSKKGIPPVIWAMTGGTRGSGIQSGSELRENLANGMEEKDIDKLTESCKGQAVIDEYVNDRSRRSKAVEHASEGVFNEETAKGEMMREHVVDHHEGNIINTK